MRVEREDGTPIGGQVWAVLSRQEAFALMESLVFYFVDDEVDVDIANQIREAYSPAADPAWHTHIGEADELTVAIEIGPAD